MIYTIALILFLAAIVFFHYIEGAFSATLSAIFAVISAVIAVGYHETIVNAFLGGRYAQESDALVLMILFAACYLILRLVFDQLIKGNVRLPVLADKIGAAVMGLIVGIFALGIVTIAAEELPFGPKIAGYARYGLADDREVPMHVSGYRNDQTPTVSGELASDEVGGFDSSQKSHVFPDVDDAVVDTVAWVSAGSLAGKQPLTDIHPDLLQELFGDRIGIEPGANHAALNLDSGAQQVSVSDVYTVHSAGLTVLDQYDPKLRAHPLESIATIQNLDKQAPDKMLLVVRTKIAAAAAEQDTWFRFGPGNIHLVAPQAGETTVAPGDYYPIGTLEGSKLYVDKPDDYLFLNTGGSGLVDLVFEVDKWKPAAQMPDGSFLEVKRLARVDLSGKTIATKPPAQPSDKPLVIGVQHVSSGPSAAPPPPKPGVPGQPTPAPATPVPATPPTATPQPPANPAQPSQHPQSGNPLSPQSLVPGAGGGILDVGNVTVSPALPIKVGVSAAEAKKHRGSQIAGGVADLQDGKARGLTLDGSSTQSDLEKGDVFITELAPPKGKTLVRIEAKPGGDNTWAWASHVQTLTVTDIAGANYQAEGVVATINQSGTPHVLAVYTAGYPLDNPTPTDGQVTSLVFYVAVPTGTQLKQLTLDGKSMKDLSGLDTTH